MFGTDKINVGTYDARKSLSNVTIDGPLFGFAVDPLRLLLFIDIHYKHKTSVNIYVQCLFFILKIDFLDIGPITKSLCFYTF